jgi:acetylornithine deacetylase
MRIARQLLGELVALDSTSSRSNGPIIDLLAAEVSRLGFQIARHAYRDEQGVEKVNLVALSRANERPALALVGHSDAVPFDPSWAEALSLTEREGKLFGRGACDTKAFIACALSAVERVGIDALSMPLALIFTADEEVGCAGAKRLADARVVSPRYAIVGEPTSLTPIRANKGYCLAEVTVRGREGHSAYPATGVSAILKAARLLVEIEGVSLALQEERDVDFDPPFTTVNVGVIRGGKAKNIIPGACRFTLEWRPIPGQPISRVLSDVQERARAVAAGEGVEVVVEPLRGDSGVRTAKESAVVRFLEELSGKESSTVAFGTEAPQLTAMGAEAVVFGPGDIRVAHRTGEFVPIAEMEACTDMLAAAIVRFCGGGRGQ